LSVIAWITTVRCNLAFVQLKPDTRPVLKQVLSGLRISVVLIVIAVISSFVLQFIPVRRIEAYYWHLRHGTSMTIGGYRFPVPKHWYVDSISASDVLLVNLNTGDSIMVLTSSGPHRIALAAWEALTSRPIANASTSVLGRKEFQVSGETIVCIEKNLDSKAVRLYPIECRLESALEVTFQPYLFSTKDHDQMFYSMLQQVRRL
jgi:hypothetical protein